jgi:hypothetical protein
VSNTSTEHFTTFVINNKCDLNSNQVFIAFIANNKCGHVILLKNVNMGHNIDTTYRYSSSTMSIEIKHENCT